MKKIFLIIILVSFNLFGQNKFYKFGVLFADDMLAETKAQQTRILADGGIIVNINAINDAIKLAKSSGFYTDAKVWVSPRFAYKLSGTENIIKLYDISGNNNDLAIVDTASSPHLRTNIKNGLSSCKFDSTNDYLTKTFASSITTTTTIYGVVRLPYTNSNQIFWDGITTGKRLALYKTTTSNQYTLAYGATSYSFTSAGLGSWKVITSLYNIGTSVRSETWFNSVSVGNATQTTTLDYTGIRIGYSLFNNYPFSGYISEILVVNANATLRTIIETYLNTIWAVY